MIGQPPGFGEGKSFPVVTFFIEFYAFLGIRLIKQIPRDARPFSVYKIGNRREEVDTLVISMFLQVVLGEVDHNI